MAEWLGGDAGAAHATLMSVVMDMRLRAPASSQRRARAACVIRIELGTQMDLASVSVLAAEVSLIHTLAGSGLLRHVMVDFEPRNASKLINSKLSSSFEPRN